MSSTARNTFPDRQPGLHYFSELHMKVEYMPLPLTVVELHVLPHSVVAPRVLEGVSILLVDEDRASVGIAGEEERRWWCPSRGLNKLENLGREQIGMQRCPEKVPGCTPEVFVPAWHVTEERGRFVLLLPKVRSIVSWETGQSIL